MDRVGKPKGRAWVSVLRALSVLALLYCFLLSVKLLGEGFTMFGRGAADQLIKTTANPFIGLFIGIFATSLVQSSSCTTSMVVGLVSSGALTIDGAIPIIMGANIGTTVTNLLVALTHVTRKTEFRRALSAASMHDFFNMIAVIVLFPFEMATGYLHRAAVFLADHVAGIRATDQAIFNPLKRIIDPVLHLLTRSVSTLPGKAGALVITLLAFAMLILALYLLVKSLKNATLSRLEVIFDRFLDKHGLVGLFIGFIITATVQSSSVTTSLMVPMAAAGIITPQQVFPITLGANLGTTVTALLAALTGNVNALAIALVHFLFNFTGILLIYPVPAIRGIPVKLAGLFAGFVSEHRFYAFAYVVGVFYILPLAMIFIYRLLRG